MESIKLAKYVPDGKVIHISEAKNGLSCNCICLECSGRLVAVQGQVREKHFRHYDDTACLGGQETALHKLAKQIILEHREINVPGQEKITYSEAVEEQSLGIYRPDVTVIMNGKPVYFEIAVTHRTEESKWTFYERNQHNSVEIDIGYFLFDGVPSLEEIKTTIIEDLECKQVIFWEKEVATLTPVAEKREIKENSSSGILGWLVILAALILPFAFKARNGRQRKVYSERRSRRRWRNW